MMMKFVFQLVCEHIVQHPGEPQLELYASGTKQVIRVAPRPTANDITQQHRLLFPKMTPLRRDEMLCVDLWVVQNDARERTRVATASKRFVELHPTSTSLKLKHLPTSQQRGSLIINVLQNELKFRCIQGDEYEPDAVTQMTKHWDRAQKHTELNASSFLQHVFLPTFWNRTTLLPGVTYFHTPCHVSLEEVNYLYWIQCIQSRHGGCSNLTPGLMVEVLTAYVHTMHYRADTIQDSHGRAVPMESFDDMFVRLTMDCEDWSKAVIRLHQQLIQLENVQHPLVLQLQQLAEQYTVGACLCTAGSAKAMFSTDEGEMAHMFALFVPSERLDTEDFTWYSPPKALNFYRLLVHLYLPDQRTFSFTSGSSNTLGVEMDLVARTPGVVKLLELEEIPEQLRKAAIQAQRFEHPSVPGSIFGTHHHNKALKSTTTYDPTVQFSVGRRLQVAKDSIDVFVKSTFAYETFLLGLLQGNQIKHANVYEDVHDTLRIQLIW